ncbi:MAG: ABC transporter ATP-binding protein [Roseiflexaceae bacterium]|nr:ABC transporter ATP-binding protein [Roseiflexaceae bacterium]
MRLYYSQRRYVAPIQGAAALELDHIKVTHSGRNTPVVQGISLEVAQGELVALVGPNGAGKSTILKAIAGLLPTQAGSISIFGLPIGACHHRVAYLPQRGEIDWRFPVSVRRMVLTGRYVHLGWLRQPGANDNVRVNEVLTRLGIADLAERQISELSGGQQQRVLLARALVQDADLLLLDEPTNAVDAATRDAIAETLNTLRRQGKAALVATHDLDHLMEFDRVVALQDGRIVADAPAALYVPDQWIA